MTRRIGVAILVAAFSAAASHADARPRRRFHPWLRVSATAYCDRGTTRSGEPTRVGAVAADPRVIPLGSTIQIRRMQGMRDGRYKVLDTGREIKWREIDVFIPNCAAAKRFGRQTVLVRLISRPSSDGP